MNQQTRSTRGLKPREKRSLNPSADMVYGKLPPQAREMEEAVLGACMLQAGTMDIVSETLTAECFYLHNHQLIFTAMQSLDTAGKPIDIHTVGEELKKQEKLEMVGGEYALMKLTNSVVSSAHAEAHCRIIMEKFIQREIIRIGGEMVQEGYEDATDVFELLDTIEGDIMNISMNNLKTDFAPITTGLVNVLKRVEELRNQDRSITGVTSGFHCLDKSTHGWQPTDLIILAARPSVGKTAFALNLARNAAMDPFYPVPVGIFSLEMSTDQLVQRMLSSESGIPLDRIQSGKLDDERMAQLYREGVQKLAKAPIYIDDSAGINMFQLRAKARRMKKKHGVGLILIDYLQLMSGDGNKNGNREQEISSISRNLKKLAKDMGVPIIALSQMSRTVETRSDKEPQLSDLRESGAIEQDADMVMFIYRPSKKDVEQDADLRDKGMIKIAKHRHGSLEDFVFNFKGAIQKWIEIDEESPGANFTRVSDLPIPNKRFTNYTEPDREDDAPF